MSDPIEAPEPQETLESPDQSLQGIWDRAEAALPKTSGSEEQEGQPAETPAPQAVPAEEPEHVKWAKRAQGFTNPETGDFDQDRILKQAYENHKTWQRVAQESSTLKRLMEHPEVAAAVQRSVYGQPPPQPQAKPEDTEKTDEQVLEDFVLKKTGKVVEPMQQTINLLTAKFVETEQANTVLKLEGAFGKDEQGNPVYQSVRDEVGQVITQVAAQNKMAVPQLLHELTVSGKLYDTLATVAGNLLWQRHQASAQAKPAAAAPQGQPVKTTKLGPASRAGIPAKAPRVIKSFKDAVEAAEEELAAQAKTQ